METITTMDAKREAYQPCSCRSGKKLRLCHGDKHPASPFSGVTPVISMVTSAVQ
jgi:hypothetical protein